MECEASAAGRWQLENGSDSQRLRDVSLAMLPAVYGLICRLKAGGAPAAFRLH